MEIIVVGAGPAGLTAALAAAESGHAVTLIEQSARLGGMSASITVSGQRVDLGSHRLHPSASAGVTALLQRLLGDDLQTRTRNGRIRIGGRWVRFPLSPLDLARRLPPKFVVSAAADAVVSPFRRERADTYEEVIRAGLGPSVLRWFYGPYALKLWGREAAELHGDIARRRVAVSSPRAMIQKLARAALAGPSVFLYPRQGYGQVVDTLEAAARAAGVEIITETSVNRVDLGNTGVRLHLGDQQLEGDRLFWTAGPHHLADAIPGAPAVEVRPRHRAMVLVFLTLSTSQYTPFDAHYFPGIDLEPARLSEPKNYRDGDDPAEQTVLCAEIACDPGDDIWNADAAVLRDLVVAALRRAELPEPPVIDTHVERLPAVYPVIGPDDVEPLQQLASWAAGLESVTVLGRQGLFVADNLHHVMDMALTAVDCLGPSRAAPSWNGAAWSAALARFENNVVED